MILLLADHDDYDDHLDSMMMNVISNTKAQTAHNLAIWHKLANVLKDIANGHPEGANIGTSI